MVDLITHQLDSTFCREFVQRFHFFVANGRARGVVRAVDENELGLRVGQPLDLVRVDAKAVLPAHTIKTGFDAKRFRKRRESRIAGLGNDYVRAGLAASHIKATIASEAPVNTRTVSTGTSCISAIASRRLLAPAGRP